MSVCVRFSIVSTESRYILLLDGQRIRPTTNNRMYTNKILRKKGEESKQEYCGEMEDEKRSMMMLMMQEKKKRGGDGDRIARKEWRNGRRRRIIYIPLLLPEHLKNKNGEQQTERLMFMYLVLK